MKKIVVLCLMVGACLWAGEQGPKSKENALLQAMDAVFKKIGGGADIGQHVAGYPSSFQWKFHIQQPEDMPIDVLLSMQKSPHVWLSPDGTLTAATIIEQSGGVLWFYILETSSGKIVKKVDVQMFVGDCVFNKAGTYVALHGPDSIGMLSVREASSPIFKQKKASVIVFNPQNDLELLCASATDALERRNVRTGDVIEPGFGPGSQSISNACLSPNGERIVLLGNKKVGEGHAMPAVWDIRSRKSLFPLRASYVKAAYPNDPFFLSYSPDGAYVVLLNRRKNFYAVDLCDATSGAQSRSASFLKELGERSLGAPFFIDSDLIMALDAARQEVFKMQISTGNVAFRENITAFAFNKSATVMALGLQQGGVYMRDLVYGSVQVLDTGKTPIDQLRLSDDGNTLVTSDAEHGIRIWRQGTYGEVVEQGIAHAEGSAESRPLLRFLRDLQLIALAVHL